MLKLGQTVKPYGKVAAVGTTGGERHYWFVDKRGDVAMMPAFMFDKLASPNDSESKE